MIMNINFKSHSVLQLYFTSKVSEKQVLNQHSVTWTLQNKLCTKRFCFQWTLPSFPCPIWTEYPAQVTLKWYSCFLGLREGEGLVGRSSTRGNKNKNKAKRLKKTHFSFKIVQYVSWKVRISRRLGYGYLQFLSIMAVSYQSRSHKVIFALSNSYFRGKKWWAPMHG